MRCARARRRGRADDPAHDRSGDRRGEGRGCAAGERIRRHLRRLRHPHRAGAGQLDRHRRRIRHDRQRCPGLQRARLPDLEGFNTSWTTPGVSFGATQDLSQPTQSYLDSALTSIGPECDDGETDVYDDGLYVGNYLYLPNCGGVGTEFLVVAAMNEEQTEIVIVSIQMVSDEDKTTVRDAILTSFLALLLGPLPPGRYSTASATTGAILVARRVGATDAAIVMTAADANHGEHEPDAARRGPRTPGWQVSEPNIAWAPAQP